MYLSSSVKKNNIKINYVCMLLYYIFFKNVNGFVSVVTLEII